MNQILTQGGRSLRGEHGEGILWSKNDVYAQVMGVERYGRVCGVGFGPTPSGRSGSNLSCYTSTPPLSSETTHQITELETSLGFVMDQLSHLEGRHQEQLAKLDVRHKEQLAKALAQSDAKHKEQMTEMMLHMRDMLAQFSPLLHSSLPFQVLKMLHLI